MFYYATQQFNFWTRKTYEFLSMNKQILEKIFLDIYEFLDDNADNKENYEENFMISNIEPLKSSKVMNQDVKGN